MAKKASAKSKADDMAERDSTSSPKDDGDASSTESGGELGTVTSEAADQVQENAGRLVDQIQQQASSQLNEQKDKAVSALETATLVIQQVGEQVRQQEHATTAGYVDDAAQRVKQWTDSLREQDVSQIVEETEQFARRQPALFLASGIALGLLGTRFFRSSARGQESEQQEEDASQDSDATQNGPKNETSSSDGASASSLDSENPSLDAALEDGALPEDSSAASGLDEAPHADAELAAASGRQSSGAR